jgi:2-polyprenyl-3-methyl-5-hydroxy-6-metoxy-1,4-benzoquinol methylase
MANLLVLKALDADSAHAPEFQYLLSHCLLEAREVFDRVELVIAGERPASPDSGRFDAVLLLSSGNVLLCRRSLAAMWELLQTGLHEVRPYRLADAGLSAPVYTLRGYELAERSFLERGPAGVPLNPSRTPVSLLTFDPVDLTEEERTQGIGHAGLFHEFIDYYGEVRSDVLPFIPTGAREVLEVGCGRGVTGRLLQETLGCRVTGVELNPVVAREAARHLHRVIQGDVQDLEIEGGYDVVLALEVVEHLVEAEAFLARIKSLLAPGGRAILSIPNVGHYSIVEDLLAGRWDYLPIGLLCYTHYRFFTRRTLADWLRRAGIESFELVAQKTELPRRLLELTGPFEVDPESLATKGFYVLIHG